MTDAEILMPNSAENAAMGATATNIAAQAQSLRAHLAGLPSTADICDAAKPRLREAEAAIQQVFEAETEAADVVYRRAYLVDQLTSGILDWADTSRYPGSSRNTDSQLAVVAVGGYGRGELAPGSDIDLIFLYPHKGSGRVEQLVETTLYTLWDLGLKVGHAVRSVDEALRAARDDLTIMTAALETRLIWGNPTLFIAFQNRLRAEVLKGREAWFIEQKLAERDRRHRRVGDSRYLLEPNIKEGKGGLRDLQLLMWIGRFVHGCSSPEDMVSSGMIEPRDLGTYRRCLTFLLTVRCHLHYLAGRPEERLTFDRQQVIAERMHFRSNRGLSTVERFMKRFYLVAKEVGALTRIVCAALEEKHRRRPVFGLQRLGLGRRQVGPFVIEQGRIGIEDAEVFNREPERMLELFQIADERQIDIKPSALRAIQQHLHRLGGDTRHEPKAVARMIHLLTRARHHGKVLTWMNECGVLGRFIPEFGRIVGQMQYNLYHVYTVDEHTIRVIDTLDQIADGRIADEVPLATEIMAKTVSKDDLYLAAFFHDIGKGSGGDHSSIGARIAEQVMARWQLPDSQVDTVVWLVRHHLLMTNTAFSRDLDDAKSIQDFVMVVQSPERLKLLLLLTVADIRGVGPTVWNGWKGQLLRRLYREAETLLVAGDVVGARHQAVADAKREFAERLADTMPAGWTAMDVAAFLERHEPRYWLAFSLDQQFHHAALIADVKQADQLSGVSFAVDEFRDRTEMTVYAPDHPGLFMEVAGALAVSGASIVDAHVSTTQDGMALDSFGVQDAETGSAVAEPARLKRIRKNVRKALSGELALDTALEKRRRLPSRTEVFRVAPRVLIDNGASRSHTVIELNGRDRPGLVYAITRALKELGLVVSSAHITTFGERAVDVVYVKDVFGMKITAPGKIDRVRTELLAVMAGANDEPGAPR